MFRKTCKDLEIKTLTGVKRTVFKESSRGQIGEI